MCNICRVCTALIIGRVAIVILLHLEVVVEVEYILACDVPAIAIHSVLLYCCCLIYQR